MVAYECYATRRPPCISPERRPGEDPAADPDDLYEVRVIDNDYNTYQEVMDICMVALGVSMEEAYAVAWEVDHLGSCVVALAPLEQATAIAQVIRTIGIEVRVDPAQVRH
jgi:ATP-dependent Clp protease adapter protein ClpS